MATQIPQIEKYIRELIATNCGSFNREAILVQSKEWMENFPVEFNSVLNMIEAEGRNVGCDEMMDDSVPTVAPYHEEYSGNIMPDHMSSVSDSPMGSDHIDSSPGGYPDDEFESDMPLQRTMSCAPSRR